MPCRIPETKRRTIEVNIALEKPAKEIAKDVNVSRRSIPSEEDQDIREVSGAFKDVYGKGFMLMK